MSIDYAALTPGQKVSEQTYRLDADTVERYVEAVEDRSGAFIRSDGQALAPPMAIAALSLRGVVNDLAIPGGTVHAGQELEFQRAVDVGETLACRATVAQNSVRGEWRYMSVQLVVEDSTGRQVMSGRSTLVLPV